MCASCTWAFLSFSHHISLSKFSLHFKENFLVDLGRKHLGPTIYFLLSPPNQTHSKKVFLSIFSLKFSICPISLPNKHNIKDMFLEEPNEKDWRNPLKDQMVRPERNGSIRDLKDYALIERGLYHRLHGGILSRCVNEREGKKKLNELLEQTYRIKRRSFSTEGSNV